MPSFFYVDPTHFGAIISPSSGTYFIAVYFRENLVSAH